MREGGIWSFWPRHMKSPLLHPRLNKKGVLTPKKKSGTPTTARRTQWLKLPELLILSMKTLRKFNTMASKQGDLEKYVVELPNLLYEPIVGVQPMWPDGIELLVKHIYADTAVLDCALPILSCRIKCVPIYVVSLPCHNCKFWPFCQL